MIKFIGANNLLLKNFFKFINLFKKTLTAYDLFAIAVVSMLAGHVVYYFIPDVSIYRMPDRITVIVFLISVGYNSGAKFSNFLIMGAVVLTYMNWLINSAVYIDVLGTFFIVRMIINPIMDIALKSKLYFWGVFAGLVLLIPLTYTYIEYGTLAVIMAMAGWANRNRHEVSEKIIEPRVFFIVTLFIFLLWEQYIFQFSLLGFLAMGIGSAYMFYILYNMKVLLLNSFRRKPQDIIEKICSFLGHKSLEIYVVHVILFQMLLVYISL